ncbi:MAG: N-acetyl-gamma-glutamyl-phosphate reductase [Verrucomicrobiota bacterium]
MLRTAIVGASGYSGEELLRVLLGHPRVEVATIVSRSLEGTPPATALPPLAPLMPPDLAFENLSPGDLAARADLDCVFLALPHGVAAEFAVPLRAAGKVVIDLSADFRLNEAAVYEEFYGTAHPAPELLGEAVYGLPELHRDAIRGAGLIAAPGCYPTSIILGLAPALQAGLIDPATIVANSISGSTGAGRKADARLLLPEVAENLYAYGVPKHRHLSEIEQELSALAGRGVVITFIPHLGPLARGIQTSITANLSKELDQSAAEETYHQRFQGEPFVHVHAAPALPAVKNVVRTNRIELAVRVDPRTRRLLIFACEDNLGKGAATQAVQAMNVRFGLPETEGLPL